MSYIKTWRLLKLKKLFMHPLTFCAKSYSSLPKVLNVIDSEHTTTNKNLKSTPKFTAIKKHLIENEVPHSIVDLANELFLGKYKFPYLYLINKNTAKQLASMILHDLLKNNEHLLIAEVNPGLGLLTKELLEGGLDKISLYEPNSKFMNYGLPLNELCHTHSGHLSVYPIQFLQLWQLKYDEKFQKSLVVNREPKDWVEEPTLAVIATISNISFITELIRSVVYESYFVHYGRPKLYLCMPPSVWEKLIALPKSSYLYRWRTIMFHVLFDSKKIGTVNRNSFTPVHKSSILRIKILQELNELDKQYMYVVEIEPKKDLFTKYFTKNDLLVFWYFLRNNISRKSGRIIPELEKWAPGCGEDIIIKCNHNIYTEFGELTPKELIDVFRTFISNPHYDQNGYLSQMQHNISVHIPTKESEVSETEDFDD